MRTIHLLQRPIIGTDDYQPIRAYEEEGDAEDARREANANPAGLGGYVVLDLDLLESGEQS
jgi:hypothetical protein